VDGAFYQVLQKQIVRPLFGLANLDDGAVHPQPGVF